MIKFRSSAAIQGPGEANRKEFVNARVHVFHGTHGHTHPGASPSSLPAQTGVDTMTYDYKNEGEKGLRQQKYQGRWEEGRSTSKTECSAA